jgi:hypothetical protein
MRVVLLGAGASRTACYPLASQLMEAVKAEAEGPSGKNLTVSEDWKKWQSFKDSAHGAARALLCDPNPEVVLSFLDLCAASDAQVASEADEMTAANDARVSFLRCLEHYFQMKHLEDSKSHWRRDYLRPVLAELCRGDVVITLNWDTTIERTLYEDGHWTRWNPVTGYGFRRELYRGLDDSGITPHGTLPAELDVASKIQVLKLHGSVGWHETSGDRVYFSDDFLDWFQFSERGEPLSLRDPLAPRLGPEHRAVWAYPSFLKRFRGKEMRQVWQLADEALRQAERVEVWGYSLPESDSAVRVLLNVLPGRFKRGELAVCVHLYGDRPEARKARYRWRTLLGNHKCVDNKPLG